MLLAVPTYILDAINKRLDEEIAKYPNAEKDRDVLMGQLLSYVNEHGVIPDFTLQRNDDAGARKEGE